ncbi:hypothetical protein JTE90_024648 [Oedothorax gibbosus]|uniref:Uncharacterized protein n=1 Tax=Oedothorax gibbosus TaxID=931172 RepID=A0AAV6U3S1_9ARAC|nr:hypothetical protein JTE90_024648 [Oedothorax gibbosus]
MNRAFVFYVILLGTGTAILEANALPTGSEDSYQTVLPRTQKRPVVDVSNTNTVNVNGTVTQSTIPFRSRASYNPRPIQHIPYTLSPIDNIATVTPSPSDLIDNRSMCFNSNVGKFCIVLVFSLENNSSVPDDNFMETSSMKSINNSSVRHWHLNKNGSLCYGSICVYLISAEEETSVSSVQLADVSTFTPNYGNLEDSLTTTVGSTMNPWDLLTCRTTIGTVGCLPSGSSLEFSPTDESVENNSTVTEEPTPLSDGIKEGDLITISSSTTSYGSTVTADGIKEDDMTTSSSLTTSAGSTATLVFWITEDDMATSSSLTTSDGSTVTADLIKEDDMTTSSSSTSSDGSTVTADGIKEDDIATSLSLITSDGSTVAADLIKEDDMETSSSLTTSDGSAVKGGLTTVAVSSTTCQPGIFNFWHCP